MNKRARLNFILFTIALVISLAVIIIGWNTSKNENTIFDTKTFIVEISEVTIDGVTYQTADVPTIGKGETVTYTVRIPDMVKNGSALMFSSGYCSYVVTHNGREIGSYGVTKPLAYGNMLGNIRVMVDIGEAQAGEEITITCTSYYSGLKPASNIYVGNTSELRSFVLSENMDTIVSAIFYLTIMVLSLAIAINHAMRKRVDFSAAYLSLSAFIFCIITWQVCSSDLPQFFTNQNEMVSLSSFIAISFIGSTFLFFCYQNLEKGDRLLVIAARIGLILPVANALFFIAGIFDPPELMYISHGYLGVCIVMAIISAVRNWGTLRETRYLVAGIACIAVGAVIALVIFYQDPMATTASIALNIAFALFVFFMFAMILSREQRMIEEKTSDDIYRKMAFLDYMTGCGNRAAYEKELEEAANNGAKSATLIMFDVNYLKTTNDELGHAAGDEKILGTAECISKAFAPKGKCYRTGGDEFLTILWDAEDELETYFEKFRLQIEFYNAEHVIPVSVSYGYATRPKPEERSGYDELYRLADKDMYRNKMRFHAEQEAKSDSEG